MPYVPGNLTVRANQVGQLQREWLYVTASDADATIVAGGYFADGAAKGMVIGDVVDVVATTGPKYKRYQVTAVSAATGAATVAAPIAIT
jgi:hypothetical protein